MLTEERKQEILDWSNKGQIKFQLWLEEHEPGTNFLWHDAWWNRNVFIREDLFKLFGYDYEIVGKHYSKSIECPVILVKYKNAEIIFQYNFYDWQIMVNSNEAVELNNLDLCHATGKYFYYQGIPEEYRFEQYSDTNNKQFAIDIYDDLKYVFAFMIMLKIAIDKNDKSLIYNSKKEEK